jgi:hypothetical protein
MSHEQESEIAVLERVLEAQRVPARRRESKNPASEVRRLLIAAAQALPAGLPLWVNKAANQRVR